MMKAVGLSLHFRMDPEDKLFFDVQFAGLWQRRRRSCLLQLRRTADALCVYIMSPTPAACRMYFSSEGAVELQQRGSSGIARWTTTRRLDQSATVDSTSHAVCHTYGISASQPFGSNNPWMLCIEVQVAHYFNQLPGLQSGRSASEMSFSWFDFQWGLLTPCSPGCACVLLICIGGILGRSFW